MYVRVALSDVRYRADPTEVLIAEGRVPLQRALTESISRMAEVRVVVLDCCTRVFSRSNGCSRTDDVSPEMNPDAKCDFVVFWRMAGSFVPVAVGVITGIVGSGEERTRPELATPGTSEGGII